MKRYRLDPKKPTKTDLARIDRMTDKDIDYSDIPALDDEFFKKAKQGRTSSTPPPKKPRSPSR